MRDFLAEVWQSAARRFLCYFLAVVSLMLGVAAYLCIVSVVEGALHEGFAGFLTDPLAMKPSITVYPWLEPRGGQDVSIPIRDVVAAVEEAVGRQAAYSVHYRGIDAKIGRSALLGLGVEAVSPNSFSGGFMDTQLLVRGRALDPEDDRQGRAVCLIPVDLAMKALGGSDPLGQDIRVAGRRFRVIGITRKMSPVMVPFATAATSFTDHRPDSWHVNVIVTEEGFWQDLDRIDARLSILTGKVHNWRDCCLGRWMKREYVSPKKGMPLHLASHWLMAREEARKQRSLRIMAGSLAVLCLLSGLLGLVNMLLANLSGRIHEIGLRRALGATRWRLAAQVLCEAASAGLLGGVAGALLGSLLVPVLSHGWRIPPITRPLWVVAAIAVSTLTALLAGLIPARAAMRVSPAESLREL